MKPNQNHFDDLIRQRINDLPPAPPRGWEGLERRLDVPHPTDAALAAKLAALSPTPPAGAWEALSEKLAAREEDNAAAVDQAVAGSLHQVAPARVSGWSQLAARLELTGKRREMVASIKISEAALLLSLILLFIRFGTLPSEFKKPQAQLLTGSGFPIAAIAPPAHHHDLAAASPVVPLPAARAPITPVRARALAPLPRVEFAPPRTSAPTLPAPRPSPFPVLTEQLPGLSFGVQSAMGPPPALGLVEALGPKPIRYYLNLFVSPVDLNQIITQENQFVGIQAGSDLTTGHSFGTLLDINQGVNGIQIGLVYGYRAYVPAEILRLESRQPISGAEDPIRYGRLRYHTVSVPLNYEREVFRNDRWQFSGGLGMSMNIILSSKFRLDGIYTTEDLERQIAQYRQVLQDEGIIPVTGRASGTHEILHPEAGYLQGGSLLDNSSLYVSGNFRVERLLNDRWSLYFSPTVSRLLTVRPGDGGKGPLEDRIHNAMLRFGTRIRLTDK